MPTSTTDAPRSFVVSTSNGTSSSYQLGPADAALFGIFTLDASGCGQGAILNVGTGGSVSVNSPSNSVSPSGYISIFGTGIYVDGAPPDGTPTPAYPLLSGGTTLGAAFDFMFPPTAVSSWEGLAPGLIGVDQINTQVPSNVREGCAVPLQIAGSQPVTISIHSGGGSCVDPPPAGYGQITWGKTHTTTATGSSSESDILTVSLQASPGQVAPPLPYYAETTPGNFGIGGATFSPACPIPGYRSLGAGAVTAQGAGFGPLQASVVPLQQGWVSGLTVYQATLPTGAIQPGSFSVAAAGGSDVGAFQSTVKIGSGIQITTPIAGVSFPADQPLTVKWTGGDPNAWVTFQLVRHLGYADASSVVQAHASDGSITLPTFPLSVNGTTENVLPGPYTAYMDIVLEVNPDPSQIVSFSAPGLSLRGTHTWQYVYRFEGISIN
jgi:uncharacterized protein (TIGR03437 family)